MKKILTPREIKEFLAQALSIKYNQNITPDSIEFITRKEERTVGFFTNEHTEIVQVFKGAKINIKEK